MRFENGLIAVIVACVCWSGMPLASGQAQPKAGPALKTGDDYFNRAVERIQAGEDQGAIDDLTQAVKLDPRNAPLYLTTRATLYLEQPDLARALADAEQALKQSPTYSSALQIRARVRIVKGEPDKALLDLDKAIQYGPKDAFNYYYRGRAWNLKGDLPRAVADYDKAIELAAKRMALFHYSRGMAHLDTQDFVKAAADFDTLTQIMPEEGSGYYGRGRVELAQRHNAEAKVYFDSAIKRNPKYADAYLQRGTALDYLGQPEAALQDFQQAAALDSTLCDAYISQAYIYSSQKDSARETAVLDEMLQRNPKSVQAHLLRGQYHQDDGEQLEQAIDFYTRALKLEPGNLLALEMRADALEEDLQIDEAMADCNEILRLNPADKKVHVRRGRLYLADREDEAALADFNEAIKRGGPPQAYCHRGGIYFVVQKDYAKAAEDFSSAIKGGLTQHVARGDCYYALRDYAKAIADYQVPIKNGSVLPAAYRELAWVLATCPDARFRDGKKAVELAKQALERKPDGDVATYLVLAAAYAEAGDFAAAVEFQEKVKPYYRGIMLPKSVDEVLAQYQAKKPLRSTEQVNPETWAWYYVD